MNELKSILNIGVIFYDCSQEIKILFSDSEIEKMKKQTLEIGVDFVTVPFVGSLSDVARDKRTIEEMLQIFLDSGLELIIVISSGTFPGGELVNNFAKKIKDKDEKIMYVIRTTYEDLKSDATIDLVFKKELGIRESTPSILKIIKESIEWFVLKQEPQRV